MNIDVLDIKKCEYDKLIYGDYKIFEFDKILKTYYFNKI